MFKRKKISFRAILIIFSVLMTAVIIISSGSILLLNAQNDLWDKEKDIHNNISSTTFQNINRHFDQIYNLVSYLESNQVLKENLEYYNENEKEKSYLPYDVIEKRDFIIQILTSVKDQNVFLLYLYEFKTNIGLIEDIVIITPQGGQISDVEGLYISPEEIERLNLSKPYAGAESGLIKVNLPEEDSEARSYLDVFYEKWSITFDLYLDTVFLGKVIIILPEDLLPTLSLEQPILFYDKTNKDIIYYSELFDEKSLAIMKENKNDISDGLIFNDANRALYKEQIKSIGWEIYYSVDREIYSNNSSELQWFVLIFSILSLILSLLFSGYFSKKMLKQITLLNGIFKDYRNKENKQIQKTELFKTKSKYSFRQKIFMYFILTILIPVLFFLIIFSFRIISINNNYLSQQTQSLTRTAANNLAQDMEKDLLLFFGLSQDILVQDYIIGDVTYYEENNIWDYYGEVPEEILDDLMEQKLHLGLNNSKFKLYDSEGVIKLSNSFVSGQMKKISDDYFADVYQYESQMRWSFTRDELGEDVLRLKIKLFSIKYTDLLGYGILDIDYDYIQSLFSETNTDKYLINIIDSNGYVELNIDGNVNFLKMAIPDNNEGIIEFSRNQIKYMMYYKKIETQTGGNNPSWYMTYTREASEMFKSSASAILENVYMFILILILIISISSMLSYIILRPFVTITNAFKEIEINNLNTLDLRFNHINEIGELEESFNGMIIRLEELIDELIITNSQKTQLETRKKAAEITALQAQISPHFLYNTLNTIIYLVNEKENENAVTMIKSLSELFRYSINSKKDEISIKEEIDYAKSYTNIMLFRFDRKVEFKWDISEEVLEMRTTKLLLQPLIENALNHGYTSGKKLIVEISAKKINNEIEFEVADNGSGISIRELKITKERLEAPKNMGSSIGMYNVNSRIKLKYGGNFGLTLNSIQNVGTTVTITIPVVYEDNMIGERDEKFK